MQIYWTYKMVLPLFSQYQAFQYYPFNTSQIVRSSGGSYLAILMSDGSGQFMLFFYSFKSSQHDSLSMIQNVTDFYTDTLY